MRLDLPSHAYFGIGDHQNLRTETVTSPLQLSDIRSALNAQLLFAERVFLVAEDMLVNELLMELLINEYQPIVEIGLFVPVLRSQFDTLRDCSKYLSDAAYYNQRGDAVWKTYLPIAERMPFHIAPYDADQAYSHFTDAMRALIASPLIQSLGFSIDSTVLENRIQNVVSASGQTEWRRSATFKASLSLPGPDALRLRQAASIVYNGHFAGLFGQSVALPDWCRPAMLTMMGISGGLPLKDELDAPSIVRQFPNSRRADIGALGVNDVLYLRESAQFKKYIDALRMSRQNSVNPSSVIHRLALYLDALDTYMANRHSGLQDKISRHGKSLALINAVSGGSALVGLADVSSSGAITQNPIAGWGLATLGLLFCVLPLGPSRSLERLKAEGRIFWTTYCAGDGTFSGQTVNMVGLRPRQPSP